MISKEKQELFLQRLEASDSVNLPAIAKTCNLDFFTEVQETIDESFDFYLKIKGIFAAYKYKLIDSITEKESIPLSNIKALVEYIDSGTLLSQTKKQTNDNKPKRAVSAFMRQGLGLEPKEKKARLKTTKESKTEGKEVTTLEDLPKDKKEGKNENSDDTCF